MNCEVGKERRTLRVNISIYKCIYAKKTINQTHLNRQLIGKKNIPTIKTKEKQQQKTKNTLNHKFCYSFDLVFFFDWNQCSAANNGRNLKSFQNVLRRSDSNDGLRTVSWRAGSSSSKSFNWTKSQGRWHSSG